MLKQFVRKHLIPKIIDGMQENILADSGSKCSYCNCGCWDSLQNYDTLIVQIRKLDTFCQEFVNTIFIHRRIVLIDKHRSL